MILFISLYNYYNIYQVLLFLIEIFEYSKLHSSNYIAYQILHQNTLLLKKSGVDFDIVTNFHFSCLKYLPINNSW